jgi:hypothetical protein
VCNTRKGIIAWNYIVFVLFDGRWLKDLNLFCVSLFYLEMREGNIVLVCIMFCYILYNSYAFFLQQY